MQTAFCSHQEKELKESGSSLAKNIQMHPPSATPESHTISIECTGKYPSVIDDTDFSQIEIIDGSSIQSEDHLSEGACFTILYNFDRLLSAHGWQPGKKWLISPDLQLFITVSTWDRMAAWPKPVVAIYHR